MGPVAVQSGVGVLPVVAASGSLIGLALAMSWRLGLGLHRQLVVASVRAAAQLLAVGFVFGAIFDSGRAEAWAWAWVVTMVVVAVTIVVRRAETRIGGLATAAAVSLGVSVAVSLAVTFGLAVLDFDPVALIVVSGITVGNAVPAAALGINQALGLCRDGRGAIEAMLALGFDRRQVVMALAPQAVRTAVLPQVERTKGVGLIALPGAMTGLLLAGVAPFDAALIQLLVMFLVLGTVAVCAVATTVAVIRRSVTDGLVVAPWVTEGGGITAAR